MDIFEIIRFFSDPSKHFIMAFCEGFLVFLVVGIVSTALLKIMDSCGLSKNSIKIVTFGMSIILVLLAISVGLLSHSLLDSWYTWHITPLNPPLHIITGIDTL